MWLNVRLPIFEISTKSINFEAVYWYIHQNNVHAMIQFVKKHLC